jgi:hypothetical protein
MRTVVDGLQVLCAVLVVELDDVAATVVLHDVAEVEALACM